MNGRGGTGCDRIRRRAGAAAAAVATLLTCAEPTPRPSRAAVRAAVQPSLAAIFGAEPLDGTRPSDLSISEDGRFVAYRLPGRRPESASAPGSRPPKRLVVQSTAGGEPLDLGEAEGSVWLPASQGHALLWCSGNSLQLWRPGAAPEAPVKVAAFEKTIASPRLSASGTELALTSDRRVLVYDLDAAPLSAGSPAPRELDLDPGFDLERWLGGDAPRAALLRRRPARAESQPEGGLEAASESRSASAPESRPSEPRFALQLFGPGATPSTLHPFDIPVGTEIETVVPSAGGLPALAVLRQGERLRRSGMLPDYLTLRVTTRPARGSDASDREPPRSLYWIRAESTALTPLTESEAPRRATFDATSVKTGPFAFLVAVNEEDRGRRTIYGVVAPGAARSGAALEALHEVPGPAGGIESLVRDPEGPLVLSEASGRARGYVLDGAGRLRSFTPPEVDVLGVQFARARVNPALAAREGIALVCDPERPFERELWRLFRSGEPHAKLPVRGMFLSEFALSADGSTIAFLGSTLGHAEDVYTMPADGSGAPRRLTFTSPEPSSLPGGEVPLGIVSYDGLDGKRVWAMLYEPPAKVTRNGGAVVFLHGAGYLQQVRASIGNPNYAVNHHFHRRLAQLGYVVLAPDFRGSAGYGRAFRTDVYQNLGGPDADDVVAGKRYLVARLHVDPDRVGLYGGSYGGFLTLMCLFRHPREFAAGAALRSVTDWRTYQPGYTRPLLGGGPADVPEVYRRCSPIDHVDRLERPLLLLHGLLDDNVFAQDTLRMVEALQKAQKTDLFELMVYPSQNHAFTSEHAWIDEYQRIESFFERHLLRTGLDTLVSAGPARGR